MLSVIKIRMFVCIKAYMHLPQLRESVSSVVVSCWCTDPNDCFVNHYDCKLLSLFTPPYYY